MSEHEQEVISELCARVNEQTRQLAAMTEERNDAHEIAAKMERERDEAQAYAKTAYGAISTEEDNADDMAIRVLKLRAALAASSAREAELARQRDTEAAKGIRESDRAEAAESRALAAERGREEERSMREHAERNMLSTLDAYQAAERTVGALTRELDLALNGLERHRSPGAVAATRKKIAARAALSPSTGAAAPESEWCPEPGCILRPHNPTTGHMLRKYLGLDSGAASGESAREVLTRLGGAMPSDAAQQQNVEDNLSAAAPVVEAPLDLDALGMDLDAIPIQSLAASPSILEERVEVWARAINAAADLVEDPPDWAPASYRMRLTHCLRRLAPEWIPDRAPTTKREDGTP